ncbi:MAG: MTH1187 family thiamine-binding protein [Desulfofustis sp.]
MKVIMDLTVSPFGVGLSVSRYIAACHEIFAEAGLKTNLHAYGTNIEGEWDDVMAAVKKCHEKLHAMGVPRLTSSIKVGTRTDKEQTMRDKVTSVKSKLDS